MDQAEFQQVSELLLFPVQPCPDEQNHRRWPPSSPGSGDFMVEQREAGMQEHCRLKAIHSTRFARPCPSALWLNILLRHNGGAGGKDATFLPQENCPHSRVDHRKGAQKGRETLPFSRPRLFQ
jgi:hypothetical protein